MVKALRGGGGDIVAMLTSGEIEESVGVGHSLKHGLGGGGAKNATVGQLSCNLKGL